MQFGLFLHEGNPLQSLLSCGWTLLPGNKGQAKRREAQAVPREVQVGHQKEFLDGRGCQALEGAAQESGGVPIPGDTQGTAGCGTQCCGDQSQVGLSDFGDLSQPQ